MDHSQVSGIRKDIQEIKFQVVLLPATDMMTSLQTGLIEAIDLPPLFALLDRPYQIATYMTDLKWAPLNATSVSTKASAGDIVVMNIDSLK